MNPTPERNPDETGFRRSFHTEMQADIDEANRRSRRWKRAFWTLLGLVALTIFIHDVWPRIPTPHLCYSQNHIMTPKGPVQRAPDPQPDPLAPPMAEEGVPCNDTGKIEYARSEETFMLERNESGSRTRLLRWDNRACIERHNQGYRSAPYCSAVCSPRRMEMTAMESGLPPCGDENSVHLVSKLDVYARTLDGLRPPEANVSYTAARLHHYQGRYNQRECIEFRGAVGNTCYATCARNPFAPPVPPLVHLPGRPETPL